jgi:putative effector of murein hydrolase
MVLFSLTMYKFWTILRADWNHVPLVKLLVRDGTWAFVLLFCKQPDAYYENSGKSIEYRLVAYVGQLALYCLAPHAYEGALYGQVVSLRVATCFPLTFVQLVADDFLFLCTVSLLRVVS